MLAINSLWKNSQQVAKKLYRSVLGVTERILTPQNSGLNAKQLGARLHGLLALTMPDKVFIIEATGLKALKILGIGESTSLRQNSFNELTTLHMVPCR